MKYIKQFSIIITLSFLGEVLHALLPLPIPASIYGLILLLLALRLMENETTARRTPMPEIIDLLAKNENAVVRQIFSGVRRRMRERSGLSLSYLWCAGMRAAQADAGLGREECGVLCDAANFLGRYDASEQKAAIDTALHRLQMLRELAFAELRDRGSLYRTCGIAAGLLVILVLV